MVTKIEYQTKIVERVVEKVIDEEKDKVDDTEISRDENGRLIVFEQLSSPEDPHGDVLSEEFLSRTKVRQI